METLDNNLDTLHQFKDTKQLREETLKAELHRFESLKRQLNELKSVGKIEMEQQKKKIQDAYDQSLKDLKLKAVSDAEKNISEIERNIQE